MLHEHEESDFLATMSHELRTPKFASQYLGGIAEQTMAKWRCSGSVELPFVKIGSRVFYRQSALDAFIESRTVTHTGQLEGLAD